jgi:hypothetical protein
MAMAPKQPQSLRGDPSGESATIRAGERITGAANGS